MVPVIETVASLPDSTINAMPPIATLVASIHDRDGRERNSTTDNMPVRMGAEPSATTVPTATPVSCTAAKNVAPYIAWPKPAMIHIYKGSVAVVTCGLRMSAVIAKSAVAPTMNLTAATPSEVALSGPSARDVPVVAKQNAANSTNSRERTAIFVMFSVLAIVLNTFPMMVH